MSVKNYHRYLIQYGEHLQRDRENRSPLLHCEVQQQWRSYGTKPLTKRRHRRRNEVGWEALEWECKV